MNQDSIASIVIHYGLEGSGFEPQWRQEIFSPPYPSGRILRPPSLLPNKYRLSLQGLRRQARDVDHPPKSRAEVDNGIELSLRLPLCLHCHITGRDLPCVQHKSA